jgi:hypothetical protein
MGDKDNSSVRVVIPWHHNGQLMGIKRGRHWIQLGHPFKLVREDPVANIPKGTQGMLIGVSETIKDGSPVVMMTLWWNLQNQPLTSVEGNQVARFRKRHGIWLKRQFGFQDQPLQTLPEFLFDWQVRQVKEPDEDQSQGPESGMGHFHVGLRKNRLKT